MKLVIKMGDQFFETIFLKDDSTQDYELRLARNNPYVSKDKLYMLEMGTEGEKQVIYHLKKSNIGMYVLRDVNLKYEDFKAQIDFVVITSHHCYFVESKNYNAKFVHVDEMGNFSLKFENKHAREGIPSPISQADNQLNVLQKICLKNQEMTKALLNGNRFKDFFKTIVVFTNPNNILDLKKTPKDIKYRILKVDNLIRQIEYDNSHFKGTRLTQEEMKNIAEFFLLNNKNIKFEELQQTQKQQTINQVNNKYANNNNSRQSEKAKNKIISLLIEIGLGLFWIIAAVVALFLWSKWITYRYNTEEDKKQKYSQQENSSQTSKKKLTENQTKAINTMKIAYENSKTNGFEIVHKSICDEISGMLDNKLSCAGGGFKINMEDNNISIYHSFTCYKLEISNNNELIDKNIKYVGYDTNKECTGLPIGVIEWDNNDEYFKKIGGHDKLRELSIYAYKNSNLNPYYDYSHVVERGGNSKLSNTYKLNVDNFFSGVTGIAFYDTTKDRCNSMAMNYYYIMK